MSERLSAEQVLHSVFSDDDSDISGCDSSDDGGDGVYAYSGQQHYDPDEVLALSSGVISGQTLDSTSTAIDYEASNQSTTIEDHIFELPGILELTFELLVHNKIWYISGHESDNSVVSGHGSDDSIPSSMDTTHGSDDSSQFSMDTSVAKSPTCRGTTSRRIKKSRGRGRTKGRGRGRGRGIRRGRGRRGVQTQGRRISSHVSASTAAILHEIGITWKKEEPTSFVCQYAKKPGPTSPSVSSQSTPGDLFYRFFTDEVWELIVVETNRYANSFVANNSGSGAWIDTTENELKAFIGLLILMGIVRLPRLELYWSTNYPLINTPGISSIMPRNRFLQLWRFLHLNDNNNAIPYGQVGHDKLFKVRKLLDMLCPLFESEFEIHQSCAIDEAMIPFKGRLKFKQYMKNKPTKWGIKVFVLADSPTGYVKRLQVYTGKGLDNSSTDVGLCTRVVLDLMDGLDRGLQLYTDNFYTSPLLYHRLYTQYGINACGTVRPNRIGFPKELIIKAIDANRGTYKYLSNGPLLACSWIDKRTLYFLSTMHIGERIHNPTVKRKQADGSLADVACPPCLEDYQTYMRGVNRGDQLENYYNVGRKSRKWWRRIFFYCIEVSILNCFCMEKMLKPNEHLQRGRKKRNMLSLVGQRTYRFLLIFVMLLKETASKNITH